MEGAEERVCGVGHCLGPSMDQLSVCEHPKNYTESVIARNVKLQLRLLNWGPCVP